MTDKTSKTKKSKVKLGKKVTASEKVVLDASDELQEIVPEVNLNTRVRNIQRSMDTIREMFTDEQDAPEGFQMTDSSTVDTAKAAWLMVRRADRKRSCSHAVIAFVRSNYAGNDKEEVISRLKGYVF